MLPLSVILSISTDFPTYFVFFFSCHCHACSICQIDGTVAEVFFRVIVGRSGVGGQEWCWWVGVGRARDGRVVLVGRGG